MRRNVFYCWYIRRHKSKCATYYVSTSGNNGNSGTQPRPWQTITFAATQVKAGDTVYIKAGNYGREHVVVSRSGTATSPIVFEGYKNAPGDIAPPARIDLHTPGGFAPPVINASNMPLLDGVNRTGNGIKVTGDYITIKNIQLKQYSVAVRVGDLNSADGAEYVILDNIIVQDNGVGSEGVGIRLDYSSYCQILNCSSTDASMSNFALCNDSHNNLTENCQSHGVTAEDVLCTDYYFTTSTNTGHPSPHHNTFRHCFLQRHSDLIPHGGHGFSIKAGSYGSIVEDCVARGTRSGFQLRNAAYNNIIDNVTYYADDLADSRGIVIRDGAHHNTVINCKVIDSSVGIFFWDSTEPGRLEHDNIIMNSIFIMKEQNAGGVGCLGVYCASTVQNNIIQNCVFTDNITGDATRDIDYVFRFNASGSTGNVFRNNIVTDAERFIKGTGGVSVSYSDFWNNGFTAPSGAGNMSVDPLFADHATRNYHLKSQSGRWNGSTWVTDVVDSPCIDAGDPASTYVKEPEDNGDCINIGAYGNTQYASKSGEPPRVTEYDTRLREDAANNVLDKKAFNCYSGVCPLKIKYLSSNNFKYPLFLLLF